MDVDCAHPLLRHPGCPQLRAFADNQPITVTVDALRGLMLGGDAVRAGQTVHGQVIVSLIWSLAILAVFAPLAVRLYRRIVD